MSSPMNVPPSDPLDWAPRAARERAALERLSAAKADVPGSPHAPEKAQENTREDRSPEQAAAGENNEPKDPELERLEGSLRWLKRQDTEYRLPRIAPLPLVPGLTPPDTPRLGREGRRRQRARSLEPEPMPPPPRARSRPYLRASFAFFTASIILGAIGYCVAPSEWWKVTDLSIGAPLSESSPRHTIASAAPVASQASAPILVHQEDPEAVQANEASERDRGIAQLAKLSERDSARRSADAAVRSEPSDKTLRTLEPDAIKLLLKQGEQFANAGDLASARVLLQRAAQAGDPTAALALGATYDPAVLVQIGAVGFAADLQQARTWYEKAESLGSAEATRRLQALADRSVRGTD